jgi:REP element-mobilizing transposase RayT
MPREKRQYLPGAFFHLTARTQGRAHWFSDDAKTRILEYLADAVSESKIELVAHVIMNNHLHAVVRQHAAPLAAFVQPLLRRCALLVRRTCGVDGHVFERRFRHKVCPDPDYLRACILYVHRNPVKAGLCETPAQYPWSSHLSYLVPPGGLPAPPARPKLLLLRELFATRPGETVEELCADYASIIARTPSDMDPDFYGNQCWHEIQVTSAPRKPSTECHADLRDVVRSGLEQIAPEITVQMLRSFRGAFFTNARRRIVRRAALAGHRGRDIARYLHISESTVSRIIKGLPGRSPPRFDR